ncbi:MAG TPA: helix-turn-helix transcriptional regulator [bacterium]|nr:helix-turn-helix transcriptional regulator [bacterium]
MAFAERLADLMRSAGLSQNQLAVKSGVGQTTISAWMTGKSTPTWDAVCSIATALGVSTEVFRPESDRADLQKPKEVLVTVHLGEQGGPYQEVARVPVVVHRPHQPPTE